jgi:hypothetical protein
LNYCTTSINTTQVLFDTGTGDKRKLLDITAISRLRPEKVNISLLGLHAFTHCDTTSAFRGKGKIKPFKVMNKEPVFIECLSRLGESWDLSDELLHGLEHFTCSLYGRKSIKSVNELRYILLTERLNSSKLSPDMNFNFSALPPCKNVLTKHILRANYQTGIWKRSHIPNANIPKPSESNGWILESDYAQPLWYDGDPTPEEVVGVMGDTESESEGDDDDMINEAAMGSDWEISDEEDESVVQ